MDTIKKNQRLTPVEGTRVKLHDGFWAERLECFQKITIPDVLDKFEHDKGGAHNNYKRVRDHKKGYHAGPPWYDGLLNECIRAVSDFIGRNYDKALDERIEGYIKLMAEAQAVSGDGYLNTYTSLIGPEEHRWGRNGGNVIWQHELYNTGNVMDAAVHYYRATGKVSLLQIACKLANLVVSVIGPEPRDNIVPACPLPEEAYLKLYALFVEKPELKKRLDVPVNEKDYFDLVKFWLDMRGHHENRKSYPRYMGEYAQDHTPLVDQSEAIGHCVRGASLYAGMADYINFSGDEQYARAARRLWENIVQRKMYISGSIGSVHHEEKFGYEYQLPNDGYLETCAAVSLLFFARSMFLRNGEGEYMDVLERALYNGVLPGISLKGDEYFYKNPLTSNGTIKRWKWHECPCCPPMFLKTMGELPSYFYSVDDEGMYVNLYTASTVVIPIRGHGDLELVQETQFPWKGLIKLSVKSYPGGSFKMRLRIPEYVQNHRLTVNGAVLSLGVIKGYLEIDREWKTGDEVILDLELKPVAVAAHPYVRDVEGRVALQYGPLLYCVEETDNDMTDIVIPEDYALNTIQSSAFPGLTEICFEDNLYRKVRAIPYYAWANRAPGKMDVWFKIENYQTPPAKEWGDKLYRTY